MTTLGSIPITGSSDYGMQVTLTSPKLLHGLRSDRQIVCGRIGHAGADGRAHDFYPTGRAVVGKWRQWRERPDKKDVNPQTGLVFSVVALPSATAIQINADADNQLRTAAAVAPFYYVQQNDAETFMLCDAAQNTATLPASAITNIPGEKASFNISGVQVGAIVLAASSDLQLARVVANGQVKLLASTDGQFFALSADQQSGDFVLLGKPQTDTVSGGADRRVLSVRRGESVERRKESDHRHLHEFLNGEIDDLQSEPRAGEGSGPLEPASLPNGKTGFYYPVGDLPSGFYYWNAASPGLQPQKGKMVVVK